MNDAQLVAPADGFVVRWACTLIFRSRRMRLPNRLTSFALTCASVAALAGSVNDQEATERAHIAIVGDADRFNLGQDGYCGARTEVESPAGVRFQISSGKATYFYIRSRFFTPSATYTCEGDFSFKPEAKLLHIIRYTFIENACQLEMFRSVPGGTPERVAVEREERRSCASR